MQITSASSTSQRKRLSAFPVAVRPFTEPKSATVDDVIGPGKTLPDLIRRYYPGAVPHAVSANFGFLSRDNKIRAYEPSNEDPFVFKDWGSVELFRSEAIRLIGVLTQRWEALGWPTVTDPDRKLKLPDVSVVWEALNPTSPDHQRLLATYADVQFIVGNLDIMKKASVVRGASAGWWCVSYRGKASTRPEYFRISLNAHKQAFARLLKSSNFKTVYEQVLRDQSDPIDTNPGYPFFAANMDKEGNPTTRIKTVKLFEGVGRIADWSSLLSEVDARGGKFGLAGFPFAVAPLRRLSAGYKWNHQFKITPSGMVTAFDERGENSQRVAWMVPYVYNVLLSPLHAVLKTFRIVLPGCYHDGDIRRRRTPVLQKAQKAGKLFMAEADYSNYDRFIPVDLTTEIVEFICDAVPSSQYYKDAAGFLHSGIPIIWPDYMGEGMPLGTGWAFKPDKIGLLSGVKTTSELGSIANSVINGAALADAKGWSEQQLVEYLTMYGDAPNGSKFEHYWVQSDDTQLIASSPRQLYEQGEAFKRATAAAGVKGSLELGDRFLMRHMTGGDDRPVPARVWQNTLSNETPPPTPDVFLAGLAARTDGLLGLKTVDPFGTGSVQSISQSERQFSREVLLSLSKFITTSKFPVPTAKRVLELLMAAAGEPSVQPHGMFRPDGNALVELSALRYKITQAIADAMLASITHATATQFDAWVRQLLRDRHVPSSEALLAELQALNSSITRAAERVAGVEKQFFEFACGVIGVNPRLLRLS